MPPANPVSEHRLLELLDRIEAEAPGVPQLSAQLDRIDLQSKATVVDPEEALLDAIETAFADLPSLEASFRPAGAVTSGYTKSRRRLPSRTVLRRLHRLAKLRPAVADQLRTSIERLLRRPGPTLLDSDGGWLISLFEAPVFVGDPAGSAEARHALLARFIGLCVTCPQRFFLGQGIDGLILQGLESPEYAASLSRHLPVIAIVS